MYFKTLGISVVLLLAVVAFQLATSASVLEQEDVNSGNQSHNLTVGRRKHGDRLLNHTHIDIDRSWLWYVKYDFVYNELNTTHLEGKKLGKSITQIKVIDLMKGGDGGYPTIKRGGVGSSNVTIHLESSWNHGISFNITIYGF